MSLFFFFSDTTLAAVAGDIAAAAGEFIDGQTAVVRTAVALGHGGGELQVVDFVDGEHGGLHTVLIALPCDESRSEGAHDTGNVGADSLAACDLLKASEGPASL